jgi:hypothetical protein
MNPRELDLDLPLDAVRSALAEAAEAWDAEWAPGIDGGRLALPVVFGLRRGVAVGRIKLVRLDEERTRIEWTPEESRLEVHRASVVVLLIAAVPLVGSIFSPFWPALFAIVPFALVSGLLAWWLVVSRLRTSGPEEFLSSITGATGESPDGVVR